MNNLLRLSWYWLMGWLFLMLFFSFMGASTILIRRLGDDWSPFLYTIFLTTLFIAVLWMCCIAPSLDALIRKKEWKLGPAQHAKFCIWLAWVPPAIIHTLLLILISSFYLLSKDGVKIVDSLAEKSVQVMDGLAIALTIGAALTTVIIRRFTPCLAQKKRICYPCGYDLRGNLSATTCPECGTMVPWINQDISSATHAGQDPADHAPA